MNVVVINLLEDGEDILFTASLNGNPMSIGEVGNPFALTIQLDLSAIRVEVIRPQEEEYQPPV